MLHELSGDLLLSRAELLVHGVAPGDDFKQGLARALRERFPKLYKDFRHHCKQQNPRVGGLWLWQGIDQDGRPVRVANLFTQEPPKHPGGRPGRAHTEHVNGALHELKKRIEQDGYRSVALPRIATGVGGLDWQHVEPLVQTQLGDLRDTHVAVYTEYRPAVKGDEPFGEAGAS